MDNGKKNTPKVLTTNDIREDARNWTLAGDVGLLAHLEQFSENVISKTQETQKRFTELVDDYEELHTRFGNVTNQFLALQNCQFVENRVYDEETPTEEKAAVKVESEVEQEKLLLMQYKEAVEVGIKLLDTHFQEVQLPPNSDSEDDDEVSAGNSIVWKPKNPYAGKKFPLLIGSAEWWADDHVGLREAEEDALDTEKVISESESDMESLKSGDKGIKLSSSSSMENIKSVSTKPAFPDSSTEDLFGLEKNENLKSSVSDDFFFRGSPSQEPDNFLPDFDREEAERKRKDSFEDARPRETSQAEVKPPTSQPKKVDNAFTRELMAKLSSVSGKKEASEERLPSGRGKGEESLFDETDDSSDLFGSKGSVRPREVGVEGSGGRKGLFFEGNADDELFKGEKDLFSGSSFFESDALGKTEVSSVRSNSSEPPAEPRKPPKTELAPPPKKTLVNDLFNDLDDDDDEDSLFSTKSVDKSSSEVAKKAPKKAKPLVVSELGWDGLFDSTTTDQQDDFFGSSGLFGSRKAEAKASTDSDYKKSSVDLFPEEAPTDAKGGNSVEPARESVKGGAVGIRKAFAKEASDDPFGFSPGRESIGKKVSLLESENDEEDDLFSRGTREERKPSLKVSAAFLDDEDTALFTEKPKPPDSVSVSSSRSSLFDDVSASKSRLASVFEKDKKAEEDLFSATEDCLFGGEVEKGGGRGGGGKELFSGKGKVKGSLFDDCDDDDDLFGGEGLKRGGGDLEGGKKEEGRVARGFVDDLGDEELFKTSTKLRETKSDILRQPEAKLFVDDLDDAELFSSKATVEKPKPPNSLSLRASESEGKGKTVGKLNIPENLKMRFESAAKKISSGGGRPSGEGKREEEKEEEKIGDVLDEPPLSSNLLKCPSKDRVKIPGRRRPQSRRARQEAIRNSGVWDQPTSPRSNLSHPSKDSLSSPAPPSNPLSPSTDEEDSFKVPELDTNFEKEDQTIFRSDLFESSKSSKPEEGLLFDGAPVLSPLSCRRGEESGKKGKANPVSIFGEEDLNGDEEEGLFGTSRSAGGELGRRSEGRGEGKRSLFEQDSDEDEDELFGGKSQLVPQTVPQTVVSGRKEGEGEGKGGGKKEGGSRFVDPLGLMSKD